MDQPSLTLANPDARPAEAKEGLDCLCRPGLECLLRIAQHHGVTISTEKVFRARPLPARDLSSAELVRVARANGLKARTLKTDWDKLTRMKGKPPLIARLNDGNALIVTGLRQRDEEMGVAVVDPYAPAQEAAVILTRQEFCTRWAGEVVVLWRTYSPVSRDQPFGFGWFFSEIWAERAAFRDVAVTAMILHVMALVSPLFFQVVIDKVLSNNRFSTLYVLAAGVFVAILFEAAFNFLRQSLLLAATNKIDMRLATRTFGHLLALPIGFFEQMSAGVTVRHMQQVESVRQFLTGRLLLTALDATALFVFLPILLLYSVSLTVIVLVFSGIMMALILAMLEPFRKRLYALYNAEAERQAMLVETIHGMRTVKSSAIEPTQRRSWDRKATNAITMQFHVGQMGIGAQTVIQLLQSLMPLAVIGVGAGQVVDHTLSVGALVAFQMLSSRVTSPLVHIVSLVPEYQEALISVRMLSQVMNQLPERPADAAGSRPAITGALELDRVCFRYTPEGPLVLDTISVRIPSGAVVGIVGRSGSGKTTLTRLIQGMNVPERGAIRFNGVDIREIDLPYLRRNIGVVLQENFLFRGTVRDNIAVTKPDATLEEVAAVARLAGADEFIERLPQGFDTQIEENAANLSGGQRQRLAIARALLNRPHLLIFDEATSALDPDSEAIFMDNLAAIVAGRTVLIVSHRLSTLVRCSAIIVMERGRIIDGGSHADLLQRCPIYQHLWNRQHRHL